MKFKVTIANMSNSWEKCIESVVCKVDTPNDSNSRMNDVGNSMEIIGRVGTGEPTCELYSWSLLPTSDSSVYRNVDVEIIGAKGEVFRKVTFPNAFVVDYSESYATSNGEGTFYMMLKQKKDKNNLIQVAGDISDIEDNLPFSGFSLN